MDLKEIENPDFLHTLSLNELNDLAQEIRTFLIENISHTGGHLASNLGVVELTIALHYVFYSPEDKIFFDVGHQSYVHKILTGRAKEFSTLRQYHGISGFQKRKESEHDVWEAGHSSTSLSAALGFAVSRDLNGETYDIVPVIGDGALSSGLSFEALNQIGSEKRKIIIVLNDNNMSISRNVGALSKSITKLRAAKSYNSFKTNTKSALTHSNIGTLMYSGLKSVKDALKESIVDTGLFGVLNLEYLGPVDGHNIHDLIRVFRVAQSHEGPIVIHVITQKGRGYGPCEKDRDGLWHGVGPFNIATGKPLKGIPQGFATWSEIISSTVEELARDNEKIVALTPAMIQGSALQSFFAKYPERSFDCGIAEEHAAVFAAAMANAGLRPFLSIYSSFLQRAYDQVNHDICRMDLPVLLGIDRAGLVGEDGDTHHGVFDIGFLKPLPNLIISQPRNAQEARNLIYTSYLQEHPFAIRYPRGTIENIKELFEKIEIGSWNYLNSPNIIDVVLVSYGPELNRILDKVNTNNLNILVVNARFFKPIDTSVLDHIASLNVPVYVYETDMLEGGLSTSICEYYMDHHLSVDIRRMGIGDHYVAQGAENLLKKEQGLDINTLFEVMLEKND